MNAHPHSVQLATEPDAPALPEAPGFAQHLMQVAKALVPLEGRYGSTSELIRASLRLMEEQEGQRARLRVALMEGKQSGDAGPLDMDEIKRDARSRSGASDA